MVISYTPMLWIGTVQAGILKYQMARLPELQVDFKPLQIITAAEATALYHRDIIPYERELP